MNLKRISITKHKAFVSNESKLISNFKSWQMLSDTMDLRLLGSYVAINSGNEFLKDTQTNTQA